MGHLINYFILNNYGNSKWKRRRSNHYDRRKSKKAIIPSWRRKRKKNRRKKRNEIQDSQDLKKLLGGITDFKSELSQNEDNKDNDKAGDNYLEKYFNAKMKNQFGTDSFSNVTIKLQDILDEIILYLNEKTLSLNKPFDVCFNHQTIKRIFQRNRFIISFS